MARQDARHGDVEHLDRILQKHPHRLGDDAGRDPVRGKALRVDEVLAEVARADVQAERQIDVLHHLPEGFPMRVAQEREAEILRCTHEQDRLVPELSSAAGARFGHSQPARSGDRPRGAQQQREDQRGVLEGHRSSASGDGPPL